MRCWFYLTESRRRIAIPEADFFPLADAGVIGSETMVWTEGMGDWAALGEIHPELFGDGEAPAPSDFPTVLQMVRSLSAPLGRASVAIKACAVFLALVSLVMASLVVTAAFVAAHDFGERAWLILLALPVAILPALFVAPLLKLAKTSHLAHRQLDRGAFYASSATLGRLAWIGGVVAVVFLLLLLATAVLGIVYRFEILQFFQTGMGVSGG